MEQLFTFCFKGCLRGENDTEYYVLLEIDDIKHCTQEDIKRQYKKLSLNLHPDKLAQRGIENTPEMRQKFLKLKEAYEVLSDPKRRKVYDQMGELGLKVSEGRAGEINPIELMRNFQRNRNYRFSLYLCILSVFAALFVLPVLFSLKADGTLGHNAPWTAIWTPMWIFDLFVLGASFYMFCVSEVKETNEEGEEVVTDTIPLSERLSNIVLTSMFVLLQIFITMRLDRSVRWNWFAVFSPWFVYEAVAILGLLYPAFFKKITPPTHENIQINEEEGNLEEELFRKKVENEMEYFKEVIASFQARETIFEHLLRIWLAIFLAMKLNHSVHWDWGLVLLPIWVYFFFKYAMVFVLRRWAGSITKENQLDPEHMEYESDPIKQVKYMQVEGLYSSSSSGCFFQCIPLFMALMLISRLDVSSFSTFLIILPVFLILGCCCIGVFCSVVCLASTDLEEAEQQMREAQNPQQKSETYSPPTSFIPEPDQSTTEYGSFGATISQPPQPPSTTTSLFVVEETIARSESSLKEVQISAPATVTNIDPDID
jgi:hypothetical protein